MMYTTVEESRLLWGDFYKLLLNLGKCKTFQNTNITLYD